MINVFDRDAHLNDAVPEAYRGLERFEARKRVVADLDELGLVEKIDAHRHTEPHGDTSHLALQPILTDPWYGDAPTLANQSTAVVETGTTTFAPTRSGQTKNQR